MLDGLRRWRAERRRRRLEELGTLSPEERKTVDRLREQHSALRGGRGGARRGLR